MAVRSGRCWGVALDERPILTPGRSPLTVPDEPLAEAIAAEWNAVEERVDPRAMPLTGLANAAVDRIAPERETFAAGLARYAASDLLCYRADLPKALIERQAEAWDPLLSWARYRYDVQFAVTSGVAPVDQRPLTIRRLSEVVQAFEPYTLAGLSPLVTVSGSLVIGLAVFEDRVDVDEGWLAASVDERWQLETWGSDAEAEKALAAREADFRAGARFLALMG